jgi:hypothetical protein
VVSKTPAVVKYPKALCPLSGSTVHKMLSVTPQWTTRADVLPHLR